MYEERIRNADLRNRVISPEEAAAKIRSHMVLGFSGFTSAGYPKAIPQAIASRGEAQDLTVFTGASTGPELDGVLTKAGLMSRRSPFQSNVDSRKAINEGTVEFFDQHLGLMPRFIRDSRHHHLDYAIIECCLVTEDGGVVPTLCGGSTQAMLEQADHILLELNLAHSAKVYGIHDNYREPGIGCRRGIPIYEVTDRIGTPAIPCDIEKIKGIVITDDFGATPKFTPVDEVSTAIAGHLIDFLKSEIAAGALPEYLYPLQSGVGSVANAVLAGLMDSGFRDLTMYTEVVQDSALELLIAGRMRAASATSLSLSRAGLDRFYSHLDQLKGKIVLRPQDISNHPEIIRRLGVITMNTAIEADIYGNINSTNIMGSRMMNGIGGSGDFARNAQLSIFMTPSTAKGGVISSIVPMVTHVDNISQDVHVLVTEYGAADLRGKSPKERAEIIIETCCHPDFREPLWAYYKRALAESHALHNPVCLTEAFRWHERYLKKGAM